MHAKFIFATSIAAILAISASCQKDAVIDSQRLPTGRAISQSKDLQSDAVGTMPLNVVVSPDGKYAITTGDGYIEKLCSVSIADGSQCGEIAFDKRATDPSNGLYYGLAFGPDRRLYAAEGAAQRIAVLWVNDDGAIRLEYSFNTGKQSFPSGIAIDGAGRIFVANNDPYIKKTNFAAPSSVMVFDGAGNKLGQYTFADDLNLSNFPLAIKVTRDGSRVFVGSERDDCVYVLDATDASKIQLRGQLNTGSHPIALALNKSESTLFVANAQSDTISIVDVAGGKTTGTILLRPEIAKDLAGATPTGLALSADEHTLYATLGDMNAIAVISLADGQPPSLQGYMSVGWYPTAVAVAGGQLFITNAKGDQTRVPHNFSTGKNVTSPLYLFQGTLWRMPIPTSEQLAGATTECLNNCRLTPRYLNSVNPLEGISIKNEKIQHVIYIIKENRSYDQVLGDLPQGNGDPSRCLFGRDVTPNEHALAERFVLLDNFYASGEVSGDGWTWSTQAQANEYTIRNVPYQYSNRGRAFDYEGSNNQYPTGGLPAVGPDGKPLSQDPRFKEGAKSVPDVAASPGGHLWDMALKHNLTFRNYGFFLTDQIKTGGNITIPDNYPAIASLQPGGHDLAGMTDVDFRKFDLNYPDSDEPNLIAKDNPALQWSLPAFGKARSVGRFAEWNREFQMMLANDPTGKSVPALMTIRMGNDHTSGVQRGKPTPRCMVADNDYAVGQLVQAVSNSPIWKSSAIVIVEDDAQNGPDHVDAHRTIGFVISPWISKGSVDHSFQNTVSAVRTIECLLNLPPLCQYDAASDVIGGWDDAPNNAEPYKAILPSVELFKERGTAGVDDDDTPEQPTTKPSADSEKNRTSLKAMEEACEEMDFTHADRVSADVLNEIIWKSIKGVNSTMPPTPHRLSTARAKPVDDDDDD